MRDHVRWWNWNKFVHGIVQGEPSGTAMGSTKQKRSCHTFAPLLADGMNDLFPAVTLVPPVPLYRHCHDNLRKELCIFTVLFLFTVAVNSFLKTINTHSGPYTHRHWTFSHCFSKNMISSGHLHFRLIQITRIKFTFFVCFIAKQTYGPEVWITADHIL